MIIILNETQAFNNALGLQSNIIKTKFIIEEQWKSENIRKVDNSKILSNILKRKNQKYKNIKFCGDTSENSRFKYQWQ